MRPFILILAVSTVALGSTALLGADHLVSPAQVRQELVLSSAARADDVAAVQRAISSPRVASAIKAMGVSVDRVRTAVPTLSDREVRNLALRAALVQTDPAAGELGDVDDLLVVLLVVAIVALVFSAVN